MFAKTGNNHGLKSLWWIEGRCVHGTQKRVRSYLQPFSDRSQKFPKYPEQYVYKIPLLFSELYIIISKQVFGKFSSMFWYLPWVGPMHKSIMVRRPSTPFENIQPISQTFVPHGRDWRKSYRKRRNKIVLPSFAAEILLEFLLIIELFKIAVVYTVDKKRQ